jgi:DNA-binding transcriptional ArsR family regulator
MSNGNISGFNGSHLAPLTESQVFKAMGDDGRRGIILFLARSGRPQTASDVAKVVGRTLDATRKQLDVLQGTGLVIKSDNPADQRKALHGLTPLVKLSSTATVDVLEFGSCTIQLKRPKI